MEARNTDYTPIPLNKRFKDLTQMKFDDWTVLGYIGRNSSGCQIWECQCKCGTIKNVHGGSLVRMTSTGCGCSSIRRTTHGRSKTPLYKIWQQMINRCYNPKAINYGDYGGRGIRVCKRWRFGEGEKMGFECFLEDMGERPGKLTIHRKNNDKNYYKGNCVWADRETQNNESRHNNMITWNGKTQSLSRWAREVGINSKVLSNRLNRGRWDISEALTTPLRKSA